MFKKLKQLFCKHKFVKIGFDYYPKNVSADILECSKCGKRKYGEVRKITIEEKRVFADRFKATLEKEKQDDIDDYLFYDDMDDD